MFMLLEYVYAENVFENVYASKRSINKISTRVQSKPVYSNHFFAAKNGKKKTMQITTKCDFFYPSIS